MLCDSSDVPTDIWKSERHFVCTRWMLSRSPTASLDCSSRVTLSLHFFPKNNHPHAWKFVLTVKCTSTQTEEMTVYVCFHLFANGCVLFKPNISIQLTHSLALITSISISSATAFWKFNYLLIFYYFFFQVTASSIKRILNSKRTHFIRCLLWIHFNDYAHKTKRTSPCSRFGF